MRRVRISANGARLIDVLLGVVAKRSQDTTRAEWYIVAVHPRSNIYSPEQRSLVAFRCWPYACPDPVVGARLAGRGCVSPPQGTSE
jgi:hypothetical protein